MVHQLTQIPGKSFVVFVQKSQTNYCIYFIINFYFDRSFSISVTQLTDLSGLDKSTSLRRMNSLALSDIDNGEMDPNQSFQDPFGHESPLVSNKKNFNQVHAERLVT